MLVDYTEAAYFTPGCYTLSRVFMGVPPKLVDAVQSPGLW